LGARAEPRKYMVPLSLKGVPYVNRFVERDNETRQLEEYFSLSDPNAARRKVFVIYGLGGMGKTQLAIAYAQKYHN
jgi:Cdc6-like AAA superfamily ATPase